MAFTDRPWFSYAQLAATPADKKDVVVIGAGIAGLTLARSLLQRGWQVTLVDRYARPGSGASGNPAGLVLPRLSVDNAVDNAFFSAAYSLAINTCSMLQRESAETFWHGDGCYQLMKTSRVDKLFQKNTDTEALARRVEPADLPGYILPAEDESLLWFASAGVIEAAGFCRFLLQYLQRHHAGMLNLVVDTVSELRQENGQWRLINPAQESITVAANVVIANGAGADGFEQTRDFMLRRIRGQVSEVPSGSVGSDIQQAVNGAAYITPAINGVHHAGASYDMADEETEPRLSDQRATFSRLKKMIGAPLVYPDALRGRVSFRMASHDRAPVIGAVPDSNWYRNNYSDLQHGRKNSAYPPAHYLPGLYASLGHGSRGFTTAWLAAELIAALMSASPLPVSRAVADYVHPSRFILHQLKRR